MQSTHGIAQLSFALLHRILTQIPEFSSEASQTLSLRSGSHRDSQMPTAL